MEPASIMVPPSPRSGSLKSPLSSPTLGMVEVEVVEVLYAQHPYAGTDGTTLTFGQGDAIRVLARQPSGWWDGMHVASGVRGWFPSNFVSALPPPESPLPPPPREGEVGVVAVAAEPSEAAVSAADEATRPVGAPSYPCLAAAA